jgi:hypothetical protein
MPGDDEYDFLFKGKNTFVCLHPRSHQPTLAQLVLDNCVTQRTRTRENPLVLVSSAPDPISAGGGAWGVLTVGHPLL